MKLNKLFLLLFLLVSTSLINNYEFSKKSKNILTFHRKGNSKHSSSEKTNAKNIRSSYSKSENYSKRSSALMKSRTKGINAIIFGVNIALRISNAVLVKMIHSKLTETLKYLEKEKEANSKTVKVLRNIEIDGCSQIKLIMEINKLFFVLSQFQTVLVTTYQYVKENISNFKESTSNQIFKIDVKELLTQKIEIREKILSMSNLVSNSFKEIESDLCGDNLRQNIFVERNKDIDKEIKQIKSEISKLSEGFLQEILNNGFSAVIKKIITPTGFLKASNEFLFEEMENAMNFAGSLDQETFENFSKFVEDYKTNVNDELISIKGVLDLKEALKEYKEKIVDKKLNFLGKVLIVVSAIMKVLLNIKTLDETNEITNTIINALKIVGKICKTVASFVKYMEAKKEKDPKKTSTEMSFGNL